MVAIRIDDPEWELLAGEPAELTKLYIAIKRRMDFATGIAGHKTLLSEIVLREGFTVDPIPGRPKQKPITRETYRSAIRRLEKLGLLVTIGTMVYQFPHARSDASPKTATTELQPAAQPQQQPIPDPLQPSKSGLRMDSEREQQPEQQPYYSPINNLLPGSGNPPTTLCARDDFADARQRFAMHDDWQPTAKGWKATAVRNGLGNTPPNPESLLEFRSYWINRPDKHQTQGQWEHELAQSTKRGVRHDQSNPGRSQAQAGTRAGRQGSVSAVDKVRNAIAERKAREAAAGVAGQALDEDGGDVRPPLDVEFWHHS